jgi:CRISPR system Cascade subunit CasE
MTLFLYKLHLNLADRGVRRDLSNAYEMHRSLSRAFFALDHEKVSPFLWRNESTAGDASPFLLVQSTTAAHWDALAPRWLLEWQERRWDPQTALRPGLRVSFRLRANPTVNRLPNEQEQQGESARGRRKRLGLWREEEQLQWLERQAERAGLASVEAAVSQAERLRCRKRDNMITMASAQFDGNALIEDPDALVSAVCNGIGHGRMLGHGLLSLAPQRT